MQKEWKKHDAFYTPKSEQQKKSATYKQPSTSANVVIFIHLVTNQNLGWGLPAAMSLSPVEVCELIRIQLGQAHTIAHFVHVELTWEALEKKKKKKLHLKSLELG